MNKEILEDIIQWDVKSWGKALPFWQEHLEKVQGNKAITFGERGGGLSLWLAKNGYVVECSDVNNFPPSTEELHKKHDVINAITYSNQDITSIKHPANSFDVVMFKSVIGALGKKQEQQRAFDEIYRILKPGGYLLAVENLEATRFHKIIRKNFTSWSSYWRYLKLHETEEMLSHFNQVTLDTNGFLAAFGRSNKQRNVLAGFDNMVSFMTPKKWKYILFLACRK